MQKQIKNNFLLLLLIAMQLLVFCSCKTGKDQIGIKEVSLIPQPISLEYGLANVEIPTNVTISKDLSEVEYELLSTTLLNVVESTTSVDNENAFVKIINDDTLSKEEYKVVVEDDGCTIHYSSSAGLLWGIQTLRQILLQSTTSSTGAKSIPVLTLKDEPEKEWRGFHLDVARHMFTIDYLKELIDRLSFYKINKLQIHLTDDQGWRIEIKQYPQLTNIGAWRSFDKYDNRLIERAKTDESFTIDSRFIKDENQYGGFYTQEELRELIEYAANRGIDIIPEIDMPGHFTAAINAYNYLSCTGTPGWGEEFSYPICAGKLENYQMIKDIIKEVAELFPSKYFHIGGDEVEKSLWETCPQCQKLILDKNLDGEDGLQNFFIKEMADYTRSLGKEVMAWDDAFISSDPLDLLYTYWRDWLSDQPSKITQEGLKTVFMEWGRFYLSARPSDRRLKSLYEFEFEPQFENIDESNIIGFQACVWTEMIPNETKLEHHVFPALQAFSEVAWSETRDWDSFKTRLSWHLKWLKHSEVKYTKPSFFINDHV